MWQTLEKSIFSRTFHLASIHKWKGVAWLSVGTAESKVWWRNKRKLEGLLQVFLHNLKGMRAWRKQCNLVEKALAVFWEMLAVRIFCSRKAGYSSTLTGGLAWDVWRSITHKSLWNLSSTENRARPAHQHFPHTRTACACSGHRPPAPFRFWVLLIFPPWRRRFLFAWSRGTNLTERIRNDPVGILLGFGCGWNAQTQCDESFRLSGVTLMQITRGWLDFFLSDLGNAHFRQEVWRPLKERQFDVSHWVEEDPFLHGVKLLRHHIHPGLNELFKEENMKIGPV